MTGDTGREAGWQAGRLGWAASFALITPQDRQVPPSREVASPFFTSVPWPPPAFAGLPLPFPLLSGPASVWGGEGGVGWPGPGLTSQQLFQRLWASRYRLALRGPRVSQRVGAGTCSAHTLSAGDALHGVGRRPWQHRREGNPPPHPEVPPLSHLDGRQWAVLSLFSSLTCPSCS